jgi:nitrogen regulatory protein PII
MNEIKAYIRPSMLDSVIDALAALPNIPGITVTKVQGYGHDEAGRLGAIEYSKLEIVVDNAHLDEVTEAIIASARTGAMGDGKIFVSDVARAFRIRTGESGKTAVGHSRGPVADQ